MMAPSIQVSEETWTIAAMLAGVLPRVSGDRAFVMLAKLVRWGRGVGTAGELRHPLARKLLAGALGWRKDPDVLVEGLAAAGAVEVLTDGLRVRGIAPEARPAAAPTAPVAPEAAHVVTEPPASIRAARSQSPRQAQAREPPKAAARPNPVDGGLVDGAPLGKALEEAFYADRDRAFEWTTREQEALQRLLGDHEAPEILRRWQIGLRARFRRLSSLVDLGRCWNEHAQGAAAPDKSPTLDVGRGASPAPPIQQPDTPAGRTWTAALERIRQDGKTYALQFLQRLEAVSLTAAELGLMAGDTFQRAWLVDNYSDLLTETLAPRRPVLLVPDDGADRAKEAV